jgi:hypothetical protein
VATATNNLAAALCSTRTLSVSRLSPFEDGDRDFRLACQSTLEQPSRHVDDVDQVSSWRWL